MNHDADPELLKSLLLEALDREGGERAEFLASECGDDTELRARVEALLQAHEGAGDFLDEREPTPGASEVPGAMIGRYKLLQQIGEGGFGSVWMAEQQEPVRRKVALKIIKLGMDTKQVIARFEAERQALALMDHPNIAKVLDGGATEIGRPFFVMELVRGVPITEYCDEAKLSTRERLELFIQVCQAVQHAHHKGIIHRDIKPSNVMVTLHDARPVPMVIDFGIAKATSGSLTDKTLFTEFRQFLGTPEYMSPEQAEISGLDVDTRTDIYSLGVLLYELLTGTTPFDAQTLRQAAYDELLRLIREAEPPRPSTRVSTLGERRISVALARATDPIALRRLMSGDLDWIVMKALEKERSRRYESAASFAQDVERHLVDEPVVARPPSRAYQMRKLVRRNRVAVVAGTLVALALIVGASVATVGFVRAERGRKDAVAAETRAQQAATQALAAEARAREEARNASDAEAAARASAARARDEAAAAVAINAFYDDMLVAIDPLRLRQRSAFAPGGDLALATAAGLNRDVSVAEMLRGAAAAVETSFADRPDLEAKVRETIGVTLLGLGFSDDARTQLGLAARVLKEHPDADEADVLRLELLQGAALSSAGENAAAEEQVRSAYEGMRGLHGADDPRTLHAASLLGDVLVLRGDYDPAKPLLEETLAAQRRVLTSEHRDTIDTLNRLSDLYLWQTRPLDAEPYVNEAYEISRRILSPDDMIRVEAQLDRGILLEFQMDYEPAQELLRDAHTRLGRIAGEQHPKTLGAAYHLARCLQDDADLAERERLTRSVVDILEPLEPDSPSLNIARRDLAMLLFDTGRFDEGIALARATVASCERAEGPGDARTREAIAFLESGLILAGREEELEADLRENVQEQVENHGRDSIRTCSALGALARFQRSCGNLEEAHRTWKEIVALRFRLTARENATAWDFQQYGGLLLLPLFPDMRDVAGAIDAIERSLEMHSEPLPHALEDLTLAYVLAGREADARAVAVRCLERGARLAGSWNPRELGIHIEFLLDCPVPELRSPAAAIPLARRLVELSPRPEEALSQLAHACLAAGERDAARQAVSELIDLRAADVGPDASPFVLNNFVWILASTELEELRSRRALAEATYWLAEDAGRDPLFLNTLGLAFYRLGEYARAVEHLTRADEFNAKRGFEYNPATDRIVLAMCHQHLGEVERARELLDACAPLVEDDPDLSAVDRSELRSFLREAEQLVGDSGE